MGSNSITSREAQAGIATPPASVSTRHHRRRQRHRRRKLMIAVAKAIGFILFACALFYIWYAIASE